MRRWVLVGLLGLVAWAIISPNILRHSPPPYRTACQQNLRAIQGCKENWAVDHNKPDSAVPTDAELFGPDKYIRDKPRCPKGGVYTFNCVTNRPTCSRNDHPF